MGKKGLPNSESGNEAYKAYRNNTDQKWTRDPGLRKLNLGVAFMFSSAAANGMQLFPIVSVSLCFLFSSDPMGTETRLGLVHPGSGILNHNCLLEHLLGRYSRNKAANEDRI